MRYKEFAVENVDLIGTLMRNIVGGPASAMGSLGASSPTTGSADAPSGELTHSDDKSGMPVKGQVSSPFGQRARGAHKGTDIAVPVGTLLRAPNDGVIQAAGEGKSEGIYIVMNANGTVHKFFHLSKIMVQAGQQVKQGDVIGLTGNTGLSTGPHLHWEKHVAGRAVDPMANIG